MTTQDLYQHVIIEHHKKPRNFRKIDLATGIIEDISFEGDDGITGILKHEYHPEIRIEAV